MKSYIVLNGQAIAFEVSTGEVIEGEILSDGSIDWENAGVVDPRGVGEAGYRKIVSLLKALDGLN